jgi:hypothetical protein
MIPFGFDQLFLIAGVIVSIGIVLLVLTYIVPLLGILLPLTILAVIAYFIFRFLQGGGIL